jgi:peptide/nickel transport system permease protein
MLEAEATALPRTRRITVARVRRRLARQPVALAAGTILLVVFVVGAVFPHFAPTSAQAVNLADRWRNHAPMLSGWHLLGTDNLGRDVLVRTLYGLHVSEQSALGATALATVLGILIGGIAGYRGGWVDALLMRVADMLGVFPALMLLLIVYTYFTPVTVWRATLVLACYLWIPAARAVRAEIASLRSREFVQSALSMGASDLRIFFRHLLPNGSGTIVVAATSLLGQVIALEAMLEFLGVGVPSAVQPTLGNLIGDSQSGSLYLGLGWWTLVGPAGLLLLILVCTNLLGDGVADALRPRGRR